MASRAKEALAYGPGDGVCANIIGSANCPEGYSREPNYYTGDTCHQSSAWYAFGIPAYGPYYNCCMYTAQYFRCVPQNSNYMTEYSNVQYFQNNSNGDARCSYSDVLGTHCQNT